MDRLPRDVLKRLIDYAWKQLERHTSYALLSYTLDDLYELELKYEKGHRNGRHDYALSADYAVRASLMRFLYEAPDSHELELKEVVNLKLTMVGCYMLAYRMRRHFVPNTNGIPSVFEQWTADILVPVADGAGPLAGRIDRCAGEIGNFLSEQRRKWALPTNVPLVVGIEYARDIGGA